MLFISFIGCSSFLPRPNLVLLTGENKFCPASKESCTNFRCLPTAVADHLPLKAQIQKQFDEFITYDLQSLQHTW